MSVPVEMIVVTDASVVINLLHVGRLEILSRLPGMRFVVPDEVIAEVTRPEQRAALDAGITVGVIDRCSLDALGGSAAIIELSNRLGVGELACLALAEQHGWTIASDERGLFRAEATRRVGAERLVGTPDLFVRAIGAQVITIEEADADKVTLAGLKFVMRFGSFKELLSIRKDE
ncbi:MAG TPA: hypothetical protein VGM77_12830 [Gemmatimonadales bacterium]|jgi:predicted nucleic acid-binding protein